jgi:hypothetical protein
MYGPKVPPGQYTVELTIGGEVITQSLSIIPDAFSDASQADLEAQYQMLMRIHASTGDAVNAINQARDLRAQLDGWQKRLARNPETAALAQEAAELRARVLEAEKALQVPDLKPGWPGQMNHGTKLLAKLGGIADAVSVGNYRPTDQAVEVFNGMSEDVNEAVTSVRSLASGDIAAFAKKVAAAGVGSIVL